MPITVNGGALILLSKVQATSGTVSLTSTGAGISGISENSGFFGLTASITANALTVTSDGTVSLLEANPQAMVEDKVMPTLPLSVMNVMDGMRGTQDMIVVAESAVDEAATPVDYVVTGSQVITLNIK